MMKIVLIVAFVIVVSASPRSLKVQETAHEIARSVKSSSEYSLEEKEEILANLKAINKDAKEYPAAHGHRKTELKHDMHERMSALKTEMHEDNANHFEEDDDEEDEEAVRTKVENIHNDIKAVKAELKSQHLTGSRKSKAKELVRQLEKEYSDLSHQTTKAGRKQVARQMKETTAQLKQYMEPEVKKPTLAEKKEKILSLVNSAEEEYNGKDISPSIKSQIRHQFEEMKSELRSGDNAHELKMNLKEKLQAIKDLESKDLEEKKDDEKDFEEEESAEENDDE